MAKRADKNLIVGLDIGTSKVVAIVGEISVDDQVEIIGIGSNQSRGLKKGVVVNIESTVHSIQRAIEEAELMAGCEIHSVYTGIAGSHIRSLNSHGIVAIRDNEVSYGDVDRVIDAAKAVAIPADQRILHILPQEFIIDNQEGVKEPIGMSGDIEQSVQHLVPQCTKLITLRLLRIDTNKFLISIIVSIILVQMRQQHFYLSSHYLHHYPLLAAASTVLRYNSW